MLKNSEKNPGYTSGHSMFTHKSLWKKDILCGLRKKDKNMSHENLFWITGNYYFYTAFKTCHFFAQLSV
jgi:hypothetical protein